LDQLLLERHEILEWVGTGEELAHKFKRIGNIEKAIEAYRTMVDAGTFSLRAYARLANLYEKQQKYQEALRVCDMHRVALNSLYLDGLSRGDLMGRDIREHEIWYKTNDLPLLSRQARIARKAGKQKLANRFLAIRKRRKSALDELKRTR